MQPQQQQYAQQPYGQHSMSGPVSVPQQGQRIHALVTAVTYTGGFIGLFIDRKVKLQVEVQRWNDQGFRLRHVLPAKVSIFGLWLQAILLFATMFLFTIEFGETLVFERMS